MKPQSPMRLVTKAFLPAEALASFAEPERDEEVGAGAHALPAEEGDEHVAAQHQHQHREHEQVQVDEELREPRVAVHVADRVQVDQRADAGDEQRHRDRQRVGEEPDVHLEAADVEPVEEVVDVARGRARPRRAARRTPRRVATKAPPHARVASQPAAGLAELAPEHEQHEEAGQRERGDEPDEVEGVHGALSPFSTFTSSAVAVGLLAEQGHDDPEAHHDLGGRHHQHEHDRRSGRRCRRACGRR